MIIFYSFAELYLYGRIISKPTSIEQNVSAAGEARLFVVALIVAQRNHARNNRTQTRNVFVA